MEARTPRTSPAPQMNPTIGSSKSRTAAIGRRTAFHSSVDALFTGFRFSLDPLVNLLTVYRNVLGRVNAQSHLLAFDTHDRYRDIVTHANQLPDSSSQDEHLRLQGNPI